MHPALARTSAVLAIVLVTACGSTPAPHAHGVPLNLVVIDIDTLRADHLGLYGYTRDTSPNLDRLARRSTVFTQAVAQAPNTPPSQMALFTSLYFSVHGFTGNDDRLPASRTTLPELLKAQGFATWGFVDGGYLHAGFGFERGFDHFEDEPLHIERILANVDRWLDGHSTQRFFLFVHCYDVHSPYAPPAPFDTYFEDTPYTGKFTPTSENLNDVGRWKQTLTPEDLRHVVALYDGGIRYTDSRVGCFLASLERRGLLDSTLLVVTSDHGEEFREHGSMLHWQIWYVPNLHVPLLMLIPGRAAQRIDGPVELVDVLPTVLDLLGLPPHPDAMGHSLVPLIQGNAPPRERYAYAEPFTFDIPLRTIVTDRYQFFHDVKTGRDQLFDMRVDPLGTHDVAERERDVTARLRAALEERQQHVQEAKGAQRTTVEHVQADESTRRQLKALGYVQ